MMYVNFVTALAVWSLLAWALDRVFRRLTGALFSLDPSNVSVRKVAWVGQVSRGKRTFITTTDGLRLETPSDIKAGDEIEYRENIRTKERVFVKVRKRKGR